MKHPVLESRNRLIVWGLVWLFLAAAQALIFLLAYGSFINTSIPDVLVSWLIYGVFAISIWYPFNYFNKSDPGVFSLVLNLVLTGAITVITWVFATKLVMNMVLPAQNNYQAYWDATFPYRIGSGIFMYGLVVLSYFLFASMTNLAEKKAREAKLESVVRETELKMLRSQINPHFLFNSLNSISSLTVTDPEKARTMVVKLSDFMRYALSRKDEQPVSFRSELDNLRLYLDIEKVRFGERLFTEEKIDPSCFSVNIPSMLLQPLYENAVKHGVYESIEKVKICTEATMENGYLVIVICNNYDPEAISPKGTGTGLMNVSRRLELTYGKNASVTTEKKDNVFIVKLIIPVQNPKIS
jgi:two-component system, LytTR family, sensor kinase